jgi:hypothetical protein
MLSLNQRHSNSLISTNPRNYTSLLPDQLSTAPHISAFSFSSHLKFLVVLEELSDKKY